MHSCLNVSQLARRVIHVFLVNYGSSLYFEILQRNVTSRCLELAESFSVIIHKPICPTFHCLYRWNVPIMACKSDFSPSSRTDLTWTWTNFTLKWEDAWKQKNPRLQHDNTGSFSAELVLPQQPPLTNQSGFDPRCWWATCVVRWWTAPCPSQGVLLKL